MKLLLALTAGALGYCYYRGRDAQARSADLKEEVTRWEGEGGNVPAVAAASLPKAVFPGDNDVIRH